MGLYDELRCDYPLPDGHNSRMWQTKDTPAMRLNLYVISAAGGLFHGGVADYDRSGSLVKKPLVEVDPPFDGDINFYGFSDDGGPRDPNHKWIEYRATFRNGRVVEMTRIEEPNA